MNTPCRSFAFGWLPAALLLLTTRAPAAETAPAASAYAIMFDNGPFWGAVARGLEAGGFPGAQVLRPPQSGPSAQIRYLEYAQQKHAKVIAVDPYWSGEMPDMNAVLAAGTQLVALDNSPPAGVAYVYVGHDKLKLRNDVAALVASLVGDAGEVALLRIQNEMVFTQRERAAIAAIRAAHPHAVIHADVFGAGNPEQAYLQTKVLLAKYPNTTVLLTTNTMHSLAALRALRELHASPAIKFVAYGTALPDEVVAALRDGTIHTWIAQDPFELGRRAAAVIADVLAGKPVPPATYIDAVMVTKDNLDTTAVQALRR